VADAYIDSTYAGSFLGGDLVTALDGLTGVVLTTQIEAATALIQSYMRNNGYSPVSTTDPTAVEETVKLAVMGALWQLLTSVPEGNVSLPENWEDHPARIAYVGILTGDANLTAALDKGAAVGGSQWTTHTSTTNPQLATRDDLEGF
jgi:hypothetical protein